MEFHTWKELCQVFFACYNDIMVDAQNALLSVEDRTLEQKEFLPSTNQKCWLAAALVYQGYSQAKACELSDISVTTFWNWRHSNPDAAEDIRQFIETESKKVLQGLASIYELGTMMVARDMLSPGTDPAVRLQIWQTVSREMERLQQKHRATGNDLAREFLTGPIQRHVPSTGLNVNVTVQFNNLPPEAIEGDVVDAEFSE
jgi:hypothetical protein